MGVRGTWLRVWGEQGYWCEGDMAMGVRGTWLLVWGGHGYWNDEARPYLHSSSCEKVRTAIVHNYIGWQRTHYLLTQHSVNLRVLAEGTLDIDANGNTRLTAVSLMQQARGETRCGRTTGRQWRRTVNAQRSLNTPCWLRTQGARFWLADVPTTDSRTSWTPTDSPPTDPVFAVDLLIVSSLVPASKLMHCTSSPLCLWK